MAKRRLGALWVGCLLAGVLGCGAGAEDDDSDEELGAETSESDLSLGDAEDLLFDVLGGQTERRGEAIRALKQATRREPDNARGHLLLALARLSAVAEDNRLISLPFIDQEFAAAQRLDPSDKRIAGWRLPLQAQFIVQPYLRGLTFLRPALDERMEELQTTATKFPEFVGFSAMITMAPLPHDTGYPAKALAWAELLSSASCPPAQERFCGNSANVPHNIEGQRVIYGDVFARAGKVTKAREQYQRALAEPAAGSWRYRAHAEERLANVEDRVARWNDDDRGNDPTFFYEGKTACIGCHGR